MYTKMRFGIHIMVIMYMKMRNRIHDDVCVEV